MRKKALAAHCLPFIVLFLFLFFSCQSAPRLPDRALQDAVPLEPGAFAYIFADVPNARPILNQSSFAALKNGQLQQMLDRTTALAAALYEPQLKSAGRYRLVAWGNYPVSKARFALGVSRDWKKRRSAATGIDFWYSEQEGLSVALDQRQARVSSANPPAVPADPCEDVETPLPPGFSAFTRGAVLSCWLNSPGYLINPKFEEMGIPIEIPAELIFVSIVQADKDKYQTRLQIQFSGAAQARALATLLTIARAFLPPNTGGANDSIAVLLDLLFANPPVQDDNNLTFTTGVLSGREIALLFNVFSL